MGEKTAEQKNQEYREFIIRMTNEMKETGGLKRLYTLAHFLYVNEKSANPG